MPGMGTNTDKAADPVKEEAEWQSADDGEWVTSKPVPYVEGYSKCPNTIPIDKMSLRDKFEWRARERPVYREWAFLWR